MTVRDLITATLRKLGVIASGETPSASELNDALEDLNLMLQSWVDVPLRAVRKTSVSLTAGQASYSWGSTGDETTSRPARILGATYKADDVETPLSLRGEVDYREIADKTVQGTPRILFYNPTSPNGTVYLYPVPDDSSATLEVDSVAPMGDYSLSDTLDIPAEAFRAVRLNLAIEVAPDYGIQVGPLQHRRAEELKAMLAGQLVMATINELQTAFDGTGKVYDIRVG